MKKICRFFVTAVIIISISNSCKKDDEPFYQVENYEVRLHDLVNDYRESKGLNELVFFHDIFVEAREQSLAWKKSGDPSTGMDERIQTIIDHWDPINLGYITTLAHGQSADSAVKVVNAWINDTSIRKVLVDEFNQSGPGIAWGDNGEVYITHFFLKITE